MVVAGGRWEHFAHGADAGIRGIGTTPAAAFAQAALAVTSLITDVEGIEPREEIRVECEGDDLEDLFFVWIDSLVFEMSTRRMVFGRFEVSIDDDRLHARMWGEPVDRIRHSPAVEIKGPTFTSLTVSWDDAAGEWTAQCVVDV